MSSPSIPSNQTGAIPSKTVQKVMFSTDPVLHVSADYLGITISGEAKAKIIDKVRQKPSAEGIRISVMTKGCSGLSYKMDYAERGINITEKDETIDIGATKIFIDPKSSLFFFGMNIDYETDGIQSGFKFNNPNSKGSCGCGESFFV